MASKTQETQDILAAGAPADAAVTEGLPTTQDRRDAETTSPNLEPRFSRDRVLGSEGEAITGHPPHVLAGALHDTDPDAELTRAQLQQKIDAFHARPVTQEG